MRTCIGEFFLIMFIVGLGSWIGGWMMFNYELMRYSAWVTGVSFIVLVIVTIMAIYESAKGE